MKLKQQILSLVKRNRSDHPCIVIGSDSIPYKEFDNLVAKTCAFLAKKGLAGEKVCCFLPMSIEYVILAFSCYKMGYCFIPIHHKSPKAEITKALLNYKPAAFFMDGNSIKNKDEIFPCDQVFIIGHNFNLHDLPSALKNYATNHDDASSPAAILHTSGSTREPKGVVHSFVSLNENLNNWIKILKLKKCGRLLIQEGYLLVLAALLSRASIFIIRDFSPESYIKTMHEDEITATCMLSPAFIQLIHCDLAKNKKLSFPKLKAAVTGGDSIPKNLALEFAELIKTPLTACYGMTELPLIMHNLLDQPENVDFLGQTFPDVEVRLQPTSEAKTTIGELQIRSKALFSGYWHNGELSPIHLDNGWFDTGDIVKINENNSYTLIGRLKNIIISGGYNIHPKEIESAIYACGGVNAVCVIAENDSELGQVPIAFVIKNNKGPNKKTIITCLQDKLAAYKIPKKIYFVDQIPLNLSGKFDPNKT